MATSGEAGLTILDLEKHFNLTEGTIDWECSNEHAHYIASELNSWEVLASYLGLDKQQIEAIGQDNQNEQGKRVAALLKWKEIFAFTATYRKLTTALLAIKRADLATEMFKLIAPPQNSPISPPAPVMPNFPDQHDPLSVDQSPSPSPSSPQSSLEPSSPLSSSGISIGSPLRQPITFTGIRPIAKNPIVETLERKFLKVVQKVIELYTQSNVPLQKLKRIATHLSPDIKGELGPFFRKERSKISKAKSIDELFAILSDFWDYLQPDLLVYMVEQSENNEAKIAMSEYEEELAKCRKKITLQAYIGKRLCNLDDDDRYQIAIRLGNEWHEKTLDDLEMMRFAFADEFSLLRLVPKLHGLKPGSIIVIFSLPKSVVLSHDQLLKFFQPYNPLQVMVDGASIHDVESQENKDTQSDTVENTKGESQGIMIEEKEKLRQQFNPLASYDTKRQVTDWEVTVQGEKQYRASGSRDVLIIVSSESLQGPDIVPRRDVELTTEDVEKLQRLNLPPERWNDEASIDMASTKKDKSGDLTVVGVERSTPEDGLTREYVLKRIERLMISTKKQGVTIYYHGPGKRNTGDWCFEDGYISFRDLAQLYCSCFKGRVLSIGIDCSFSGSWVKELMKFLDKQGVRPCGHSAREKGILIKVQASCQPTEIPYRLLFTVRAYLNDKNTGMVLIRGSGFEVAKDQHIYTLDPTYLECNASSFKEPCTFSQDFTWERKDAQEQGRILTVRMDDTKTGRPHWYYVLLDDDEAKIKKIKELMQGKNEGKYAVELDKYGKVIKTGLGKDPPNDVKEWMEKNYGVN